MSLPSSISFSPMSLYPYIELCTFRSITKEQFNLYHSIDRDLYSRLVHELGRGPLESMQVLGFWLWLEQKGFKSQLIKTLLNLPSNLFDGVIEESLICLNSLENNIFVQDGDELVLLSRLVQRRLTFSQFLEHRSQLHSGISKALNYIIRAFENIPEFSLGANKFSPNFADSSELIPKNVNVGVSIPLLPKIHGTGVFVSPFLTELNAYDPFRVEWGQHHLNLNKTSSHNVRVIEDNKVEIEEVCRVPPEYRTIFLTFSKGYPLSKNDVRNFFTRKFGDFIECIQMQEVDPGEQSLFAKLVSKSVSIIDVIVDKGRAKYSINGKHVRARKFVVNPSFLNNVGPSFSH